MARSMTRKQKELTEESTVTTVPRISSGLKTHFVPPPVDENKRLIEKMTEQDKKLSQALSDSVGPGSENDRFPRVHEANPLAPGLHLMYGPARSGKTVTLISLILELRSRGYAASYVNLMEPRGLFVPTTPTKSADEAATGEKTESDSPTRKTEEQNARLRDYLSKDTYGEYLWKLMSAMPQDAVGPTSWKTKIESVHCTPVLGLDSITYLIRALPETQKQAEVLGNTTFKGGLAAADTLGMLHHQLRAEYAGVAVIAVVNQELFPVVTELAGAVEGLIETRDDGCIRLSTRALSRDTIELRPEPQFIAQARTILRYSTRRSVLPSRYDIIS